MLSFLQKLLLLFIILLVFSCSRPAKNEAMIFKVLNAGLTNSNRTINFQTASIYHNLENKMSEPYMRYRASIWYTKAMKAQELSSKMFDYLQGLKSELLKEAGFDEDHLSINEEDKEPVNKLFSKGRKDIELFQKLNSYKDSIMSIDPIIKQEFPNYSLVPKVFGDSEDNADSVTILFENTSVITATAILSQFQNNVKTLENKVAVFCNGQVTNDAFTIDDAFPTPIIAQSSTYVKASDELTMKAGLGKFDIRSNPKISINNKAAELNDYGFAEFRYKIKSRPGSYSIPVRIEYNDQDGNKRVIDRVVKYTVIN